MAGGWAHGVAGGPGLCLRRWGSRGRAGGRRGVPGVWGWGGGVGWFWGQRQAKTALISARFRGFCQRGPIWPVT